MGRRFRPFPAEPVREIVHRTCSPKGGTSCTSLQQFSVYQLVLQYASFTYPLHYYLKRDSNLYFVSIQKPTLLEY